MDEKFTVVLKEFYPTEIDVANGKISGCLLVTITINGLDLNLRGVYGSNLGKDGWFFNLPTRQGTHHQTEKLVKYSIVSFADSELNRLLLEKISSSGPLFIQSWLLAHPECQNFKMAQPIKKQQQKQSSQPKNTDKPAASKETSSIAQKPKEVSPLQKIEESLSKPTSVVQTKAYVDLPPLKARNQPRKVAYGRK